MNYKILITIFVLALFAIPAVSYAGTADNVSGFAWSENIGWVSFNCTNDHDETQPGVQTCTDMGGQDYGVNVRDDNYLEGYAWAETIGWISFNLTDTGNPPGKYDYSGQGYIAKLQSNELRGWARALAGMDDPDDGWDGWIKLQKHPSDGGPDYGVTFNDSTGEFENWAWGSDVVGWLSFNCNNDHDPDTSGVQSVCDTSNYKVRANINAAPTVSELMVAAGDYCTTPAQNFSWTFSDTEDGTTQSAYWLQIQPESAGSFPGSDSCPQCVFDSGKVLSTSQNKSVVVVVSPGENQLGYNESYLWRVKVYDSSDLGSAWVEGSNFSTPPHLYPTSDFSVSPLEPSEGEEITFTQISTCYDANNNPISCPAVDGNYSWDFDYKDEDGDSFPDFTLDATGQTATTTYADTDNHTVALDTTDAEGQTCRGIKDIQPQQPLPKFRETAPSSFFKILENIFASIIQTVSFWS